MYGDHTLTSGAFRIATRWHPAAVIARLPPPLPVGTPILATSATLNESALTEVFSGLETLRTSFDIVNQLVSGWDCESAGLSSQGPTGLGHGGARSGRAAEEAASGLDGNNSLRTTGASGATTAGCRSLM
ncbi:hypothetical protein GGX14DRAFT_404207 [Mycena pura]|uniref:Uncharacterized protein n=1 Tax=Mycena pura TaxID=153505 RepID=A0AAD6Y5H8_9AGAR|nr:hypothetical protein GGX14DRAFT_404207 [Mycena pura]